MRRFEELDTHVVALMDRWSIPVLRIALGVVYVWFGALKLFPGLSPAEELVLATTPFLPGRVFMPILAVWEMVIGIGFLTGLGLRLAILLVFLQMPGTMAPLVLLPEQVFTVFPYGLTLEGQYIVKNLVLIGAALTVGSTVRRRRAAEQVGSGSGIGS
jgi:uncharacterized membrane protein YkgB